MAACPVGRVPPDMRKDGYFMKSMKRRLLSLFMAMVMVCSLVPGALAEGTDFTATISGIGSTLTLGANGEVSASPSVSLPTDGSATEFSISTYSWSVSPTDGATVTNNSSESPSIKFTKAGSYTVSVTGNATKTVTTPPESNTPAPTDATGTGSTTETKAYSAEAQVTVKAAEAAVTGVSVNPTTMQFTVGDTAEKEITATVTGNSSLQEADKGVTWSCDNANVEVTADSTKTNTAKVKLKANATAGTATITATSTQDNTKKATCAVAIGAPTATITGTATMKFGGTQELTLNTVAVGDVTWNSSNPNVLSVTKNTLDQKKATVTALAEGSAEITATIGTGNTATVAKLKISVAKPIKLDISSNSSGNSTSSTLTGINSRLNLTVSTDVANNVTISSVTWKKSNDCVFLGGTTDTTVAVYANSVGTATVTADVTLSDGTKASASQVITVKSGANYSVSASVYVESSGYSLGDEDDKGKDSIIEQIDAKLGSSRYCKYVWFDTTSHTKGDLDAYKAGSGHTTNDRYDADEAADVVFTPDSSAKVGDVATFSLTVEDDNRNLSTFEVSFTLIEGTSAGDITYSAALGEDVYFDVSDFEDFYNDKYSSGYLEYVTFGSSSSNGTLYNEDGKTAGSSSYYVDPSKSSQKSLDGIYFSPKSSMKRSTTVKISFTARGTKRNDTGTGEVSGTVTIFYLNDSASDIVYNTTGGKVTLDPKDFNEAYKQATGSKTAPSNLTIEFQNVPTNGTLTYTGGSKDKDLTKSTVKSNRYTTKSNGTYRLAQLTYTGTRGKDTIDYIAYSGGTAQFSGKVVFNGTAAVPTDVVVTYGSTGGQAVRFSQNDFVSANSAMSKATKVRFVAPANGTLLMNGASASGVDIATTLLGTVTYQPKSGFNGQDKIIFAAYDASNNTVASGTVNITVIGNPTTGTTPGGTPGGVSDVSQFKDVSATAWYRDNLATLVRKGIITGKGDGKFDPLGTVTYGEALKMVLESCGYTAALGTGSNWAINYKNLAVSRGWISSDIDLNAAISRNATAELTAKVLGVSAVTSGSPFADEANGYAAALYYTSPQIFAGSPNPNGGKPLFKNSSPLLRQVVCAVICRVSDYHAQHTTNNMPDGI